MKPRLLPGPPGPRPGRPRAEDRRIVGAMVYGLRTGAQGTAIPRAWWSSSPAHRRCHAREQAGFFRRRWEAGLLEYDAVRGIGWAWQARDGAMTPAPRKGLCADAAVGPNPTDRGHQGVKRSRLTAADGVPLAGVAAGATAHATPWLAAPLDAIVIARPAPSGRPPQPRCLDTEYAYADLDDAVDVRGDSGDLSRRGAAPLGRRHRPGDRPRRWVGERPPTGATGRGAAWCDGRRSGSPISRSCLWPSPSCCSAGSRGFRDML